MDSRRTTSKYISWKFPKAPPSTVVVGDSQTKYLFQHFDPLLAGTPAFVSHNGAVIADMPLLIDFVPPTTSTLIVHIGTNDLTKNNARAVFENYIHMLTCIQKEYQGIRNIYATLILPRAANRRRGYKNQRFIHRFNREASLFNSLLRRYCRRSSTAHLLDHALECFPPARVLAADGVHLSFEGVALVACHIRQLCFESPSQATTASWQDCAPAIQHHTPSTRGVGPEPSTAVSLLKKPTGKNKNRGDRTDDDGCTSRVIRNNPTPECQPPAGHCPSQRGKEHYPTFDTSRHTADTAPRVSGSTASSSVILSRRGHSLQQSEGRFTGAAASTATEDIATTQAGPTTKAVGPTAHPRYPLRKKFSDAVKSNSKN